MNYLGGNNSVLLYYREWECFVQSMALLYVEYIVFGVVHIPFDLKLEIKIPF